MSPIRQEVNTGEKRPSRTFHRRAVGVVAAAGLGVAGSSAAAEVIHVDPPDMAFFSYDFDVDGDGTAEMNLTIGGSENDPDLADVLVTDEILPQFGSPLVEPLNYASLVSPDAHNWLNVGAKPFLVDPTDLTGGFIGATDKYMGLRFPINGETHYGWARLGVDPEDLSITLYEWAYESEPDTAILTPATTNVPEPSTLAGLVIGAASLLAYRAARKKPATEAV